MSLLDALEFEPVVQSEFEKNLVLADVKQYLPEFHDFIIQAKQEFKTIGDIEIDIIQKVKKMKRTYYINNEEEKQQLFNRMMKAEVKKPWVIKVAFIESVRSAKQNQLYHMWVREIINHLTASTGETRSVPEIKAWLTSLFAPIEHSEFNGKQFNIVTTSSDMSMKQMSHYLKDIDMYCSTELELNLTHPEDLREAINNE